MHIEEQISSSFAPKENRDPQTLKKESIVKYCSPDVGLKIDESMYVRLRKRIKESREITVFLSSPFQGLLEERAGLVEEQGPDLVAVC
jgi:hypothetical protein